MTIWVKLFSLSLIYYLDSSLQCRKDIIIEIGFVLVFSVSVSDLRERDIVSELFCVQLLRCKILEST